MKRILALDGGGIRGVFSLQILRRIERLLREERRQPDLVLADEFDLFAGTSTGAIIAAGLCWGMSVDAVEQMYVDNGRQMFTRSPWFSRWKAKYRSEKLAGMFQQVFCEDDAQRTPALLGTGKLRKLLLVVMRNATTGSPWPVSNNPAALFNDSMLDDCNLKIPLWQLLRGSTAAPTFFAPERIELGRHAFLFVDGAITPFNNPALAAVMMATLPCYRVGWTASREQLHVVSVGTGSVPARLLKKLPRQVHLLDHLQFVPSALLDSIAIQQDVLCRVLGDCLFGAPLDLEIGDLTQPSLLVPGEQKFSYVRYNLRFDRGIEAAAIPELQQGSIDDLGLVPLLQRVGTQYAETHVRREHLLPRALAPTIDGTVNAHQ